MENKVKILLCSLFASILPIYSDGVSETIVDTESPGMCIDIKKHSHDSIFKFNSNPKFFAINLSDSFHNGTGIIKNKNGVKVVYFKIKNNIFIKKYKNKNYYFFIGSGNNELLAISDENPIRVRHGPAGIRSIGLRYSKIIKACLSN